MRWRAVRRCGRTRVLLLLVAFGVSAIPASTQTRLTLDEAMSRAQRDTPDAQALAATIDESAARIRRAQAGFWPRVDVMETVQRGNQPVFVFGSLLSQR